MIFLINSIINIFLQFFKFGCFSLIPQYFMIVKKVLPYPNRSTTLAKSQTYTLIAEQVNGRLQIFLDIFQKDQHTGTREQVRKFSKLILLGHKEEIRRQFKTIASLIDHLKNSQNYAINENQGKLTIFKDRKKVIDIYLQEKQVPGLIKQYEDDQIFKPIMVKPDRASYNNSKKANSVDDEFEMIQRQSSINKPTTPIMNIMKRKAEPVEERFESVNFYDDDLQEYRFAPPIKNSIPEGLQRHYQARIKSLQTRLDILQQEGHTKDEVISRILARLNESDKKRQDIMKPYRQQIVNIHAKVKKIYSQLQIKQENNNSNKELVEQEEQMKLINVRDWIDMDSYAYKHLKIKDNYLYAIGANRLAIFGQQAMIGKIRLCIEIKKIKDFIGLGLADSSYKNSPQILQKQNTILYKNNGDLYYKGKYKPSVAVKVLGNQKIQMLVNQEQQRIQWRVGDKRVLSIEECTFLKTSDIVWVPIIYFNCKGDCAELIC